MKTRSKRAAVVRLYYYPEDMLVRREAEALRDLGFDVDVFCLRRAGEAAQAIVDRVRVHRLPLRRAKSGAVRNLFEYVVFFGLAAFALAVEHWRRPFAVIQVNTLPDFLVFTTLLPKLLGARVTLQMYEPMPELWATKFKAAWPGAVLRAIARASVWYADAVITVTQPLKETLAAYGIDPAKVIVVLNVPDPHLFGPLPPAAPAAGNLFTLVCHGAIEERYGHDTMLQALALLRDTLPQLRLVITGDGSYREAFEAGIDQLNLGDQVRFLGYVSKAELKEVLSQADAGIVALKASPYSHLVHTGKMYDFLHFGKPVVASRLRAVQAYFDEASLAYFEPGDPADLARVIRTVAGDPGRRRDLVENSQRLYAQYRWDCQKEVYASVYRRWL